jgi:hypothetical protein
VKCSWVKCSEGLSNRVSNIIIRYIDNVKFSDYMAFFYHILSCSFGSKFLSLCILFYVLYASV